MTISTLRRGLFVSAVAWAHEAIAAPKLAGREGYANYCSGDWCHWWHYKKIDKDHPAMSYPDALDEMAYYRGRLVEEIKKTADELDEQLKRLQKMEDEMARVIQRSKDDGAEEARQ